MQITLTPELDKIVEEKVTSGLYESPSEVVREALRLMLVRESALDWIRHEAAAGFGQLDSDEAVEISRDDFLAEMRERHPA